MSNRDQKGIVPYTRGSHFSHKCSSASTRKASTIRCSWRVNNNTSLISIQRIWAVRAGNKSWSLILGNRHASLYKCQAGNCEVRILNDENSRTVSVCKDIWFWVLVLMPSKVSISPPWGQRGAWLLSDQFPSTRLGCSRGNSSPPPCWPHRTLNHNK